MPKPISFTYCNRESGAVEMINVDCKPLHKSNEAHIWHFQSHAWKIFLCSEKRVQEVFKVYHAACKDGLPTPYPYCYNGHVGLDNGRTLENRGAVVTTFIAAPFFDMSVIGGKRTFEKHIRRINDVNILNQILRSCNTALGFKLKNPQGFIQSYDANDPILFIDLRVGSRPSSDVSAMIKIVKKHRDSL